MPNEYLPYDVFLSYSSKDERTVRDLAARLRKAGLSVWFDQWAIQPGDSIPAKIEEGLERSRVLVLCMSAAALGSDWAQLEAGTFRFRDPLNRERRFLPLRLDDSQPKGSLAQFFYIDWRKERRKESWPKLQDACAAGRKYAEVTGPEPPEEKASQFRDRVISLGHTAPVNAVAISPDGRQALTGSDDNTVRVWDLESGRALRVLEGHSDRVLSVSYSPDGRQALTGSNDNSVRVWDVESGRALRVLEGHSDRVLSVSYSPDGRQALTGSADRTVRVWDVESGRALRVLKGHSASVLSVSYSPDGRQALTGSLDNTVRVWDLESGRALRVFEGHSGIVLSVSYSPDGRQALTGSHDHTVRVWDVESGRALRVLEGHSNSVLSVSYSPDGRQALTGSLDNTVRVWDVESGRALRVLEGHSARVLSVSYSPDGRQALTGSLDNTVRVWDVESGRALRVLEGHSDRVLSVSYSPDGRQALTGSDDNTVRVWDVESGRAVRVLEGHSASVWGMSYSPDGRQALSGSADHTVRVWDVESGRALRVLEGHSARVLSVSYSPDGRQALTGSHDNTVRVWDVESGRALRVLEGHSESVWSVSYSPDGRQALSGSADHTVRVWDVESGRALRVLEGHSGSVLSVSYSPDGRQALTGSDDHTVRVWDVESGRALRVLEGHSDSVVSVSYSPDGRQALTGSADHTVRVWDVESGRALRVLEGHSDSVWSVSYSPDGRHALSTALNGVIRIWDISSPSGEISPQDSFTYTNAKVLVVGDSGAGKTGLTHRLVYKEWKPSPASTSGAWATQFSLPHRDEGDDREVWLWDFGGQSDQRLIHQLYMDRSAAILLLFSADREGVIDGLRDWQVALRRTLKDLNVPKFLVAGRIDTGFAASRSKLQTFAKEYGFAFFETSALTGSGCEELEKSLTAAIPWGELATQSTRRIFKSIKDEILKLRDEGKCLVHTFKELRELLWKRLPSETRLSDEDLSAVISLLDGPGVVRQLEYGTYVLLAPEWISAYAQAVIRTLRSSDHELGALPLKSIAEGKLIFQFVGKDGRPTDMTRLPRDEERVVLAEMEKQLEERGLCLRQEENLIFPSHCGRERPAAPAHPGVFVTYAVNGYLDDIYATLAVKLAFCGAFEMKDLWRDAADFVTHNGGHAMGIQLMRENASVGEIQVYFGKGVNADDQVTFANYIDSHLRGAAEKVQRRRDYVCPACGAPKGNSKVLAERVHDEGERATTGCDRCDHRFSLWDDLEKKFASAEVRQRVLQLQEADTVELDDRRKAKLLVLEVQARVASANQKSWEIPQGEDDGIDLMVEFTDDDGNGIGKGLCLQLKSGNSHLRRRRDGREIFPVKKPRWIKTWTSQPWPVMLVIGTFADESKHFRRSGTRERLEFEDVRWMEISGPLRSAGENAKEIEFAGERLDMASILMRRRKEIGEREVH